MRTRGLLIADRAAPESFDATMNQLIKIGTLALRPMLLAESERVVRSRQQQFSEPLRGELAREFRR